MRIACIVVMGLLPLTLAGQIKQEKGSSISIEQMDHLEASVVRHDSLPAYVLVNYRSLVTSSKSILIYDKKEMISVYNNLSEKGQLKIPVTSFAPGTYQVILVVDSRRARRVKFKI